MIGRRTLLFGVMYGLVALLFAKLYFLTTTEWRQARLEQLVAFQADRPFQERVLIPALLHIMNATTHLPILPIFQVLTVIITLAILIAFHVLLRQLIPRQLAALGALGIVYPMLWNYCVYGPFRSPYDLPAVLLFICGLIAILKERWLLFYGVFIPGVFNRETIALLGAAYLLLAVGRSPPSTILLHVAAQAVIWLSIKYVLGLIFAGNPGDPFQMHLATNIDNIVHLRVLTPLALMYGGAWLAIPLSWRTQSWVVKRLVWLAPPYYALVALIGNLHELRIYNELVPVVALALVCGIVSALVRSADTADNTDRR